MNTRFFYDDTEMNFHAAGEFAEGYDLLGDWKSYTGNENSGKEILAIEGSAGYVNGAIQLVDERIVLQLVPGVWKKLCRVQFTVDRGHWNDEEFCPVLIWDQNRDKSYLRGSQGVVVTVKDTDRDAKGQTKGIAIETQSLNYFKSRDLEGPGSKVEETCLTLSTTTSVEEPGKTKEGEYVLYQNSPNPVQEMTMISFELPFAQHAFVVIYDQMGKQQEVIEGNWPAGKTTLTLENKGWMNAAQGLYYQLLSEDKQTSLVRKMEIIRK